MSKIQSYKAKKYDTSKYEMQEDGIYKTVDVKDNEETTIYVTSLSFPKNGMEDVYLEDIIDSYTGVYVSDFLKEENTDKTVTRLEFASENIADIRALRGILN